MKTTPHCEMPKCVTDCLGIVRRKGWTAVEIDGSTMMCPAWKCDKCGVNFWSYFDTENGDKCHQLDEDDECEEEEE